MSDDTAQALAVIGLMFLHAWGIQWVLGLLGHPLPYLACLFLASLLTWVRGVRT